MCPEKFLERGMYSKEYQFFPPFSEEEPKVSEADQLLIMSVHIWTWTVTMPVGAAHSPRIG